MLRQVYSMRAAPVSGLSRRGVLLPAALVLLAVAGCDLPSGASIYEAAQTGDVARIAKLLQSDMDINLASEHGTPLHIAAKSGHADAVRLLIDSGADIGAVHDNGYTPLHSAAAAGHSKIVRQLVQAGANVDAITRLDDFTPLHLAARNGALRTAKLLLELGANMDAESVFGSPAQVAIQQGSTQIAQLLLQSGAVISPHQYRAARVAQCLATGTVDAAPATTIQL